MTNHSDAPFSLDAEAETVSGCREIIDAHGQGIATTHGLNDDDEDRANAHLFMAAPDMLAALRYCLARVPMTNTDQAMLRAVIAKATGGMEE